ncbi:MAG: Holliday junction branch migration protein RuvA [Alphaproteobacteria bacterium]|nr:Holliday junction branch migration protein RuvA [Alphaproteobacteria bacterium]
MIAHLSGRIFEIGEDSVIVDVGGVGYILYCSSRTLAQLPAVGDPAALHVETQFKAESLTLYGFESGAERSWFRLLQTVQGVGARVALALLSALTPDQLAQSIMAKDKAAFTQASGVGPRLAQRLISELQSKVGELPTAPVVTLPSSAGAAGTAGGPAEDAVSALVNLGYGRSEAHGAIAKAAAGIGEDGDVEALIRAGLKALTAVTTGGGGNRARA